MPDRQFVLPYVQLFAFIAAAVLNGLSTATVFGTSNAEISDERHNSFTPAGWAFSIW